MTAVMDDITGAVQQSPEQEAWCFAREVRAESPLCTCRAGWGRLRQTFSEGRDDIWEPSGSPKNLTMAETK